MSDKISNDFKILEKALDAAWLRNEVISQNIANIDTPGYKRKTVVFEDYLNDAIDKVDSIDIRVTQDNKNLSMRQDGNNVDIESEMASMAANSIKYNTLVQSLNAGFNRLKSVISEGRK